MNPQAMLSTVMNVKTCLHVYTEQQLNQLVVPRQCYIDFKLLNASLKKSVFRLIEKAATSNASSVIKVQT